MAMAASLSVFLLFETLAHPTVGFAKWNAFFHHEFVGLRSRVDGSIQTDLFATKPNTLERGWENRKRIETQVDAAEYGHLDELKIALISRGQLAHDAEHFAQASLRRRRATANEFEHIRIAFLR